tara:strand:+ start:85 stop:387 length:303 start_codon:yes stop_codon:yes gene_type:complete
MSGWKRTLSAVVIAAGIWYLIKKQGIAFGAESEGKQGCIGCQDFIKEIEVHDYGSLSKPVSFNNGISGQAVGQTIAPYGDSLSASVHSFGQNYTGRAMGL